MTGENIPLQGDDYRDQFGVYEDSFDNDYEDMAYSIEEAFEQYLKR